MINVADILKKFGFNQFGDVMSVYALRRWRLHFTCHLGLPSSSHQRVSSLLCSQGRLSKKQLLQQNLTSDCSRGNTLQSELMGLKLNLSITTLHLSFAHFQSRFLCLAFPIDLITDDQCCKTWDHFFREN